MRRKALIIVIPGDKDKKGYLPGTIQDANNYKNYLTSSKGGNWYDSEIEIINNLGSLRWIFTQNRLRSLEYDYSFTVFSGHGYFNGDEDIQYVHLYGGNEIPISDFYHPTCKRQTLIIDACRKIFYSEKKSFTKKSILSEEFKYAENTRKKFDDYVMESEEGIIKLFSSSKNQASGESDLGGHFSRSLIKAGEDWYSSDKEVLDIYDAFELSREYLKLLSPIQKPEIEAGRRLVFFPFAV